MYTLLFYLFSMALAFIYSSIFSSFMSLFHTFLENISPIGFPKTLPMLSSIRSIIPSSILSYTSVHNPSHVCSYMHIHLACMCWHKQEADCLVCIWMHNFIHKIIPPGTGSSWPHPELALHVGLITLLDPGTVADRSNNSLSPAHVISCSIIKCRI